MGTPSVQRYVMLEQDSTGAVVGALDLKPGDEVQVLVEGASPSRSVVSRAATEPIKT